MLGSVFWEGLAAAVTRRRAWQLGLVAVALGIGFMVLIGANASAGQAPLSVPNDSDSALADAASRQFADGDRVPLIAVVSRVDGAALNPSDVDAARAARDRMQAVVAPFGPTSSQPPVVSADGRAAVAVVPIRADLSGMVLRDGVVAMRTAATADCPRA